MLIATIFNCTVVDLREYEQMPVFAPSFTNIDITGYNGEVEVGYLYDMQTGEFAPDPNPPVMEPIPEEPPVAVLPPAPVSEFAQMQSQILINTEMLLVLKELTP